MNPHTPSLALLLLVTSSAASLQAQQADADGFVPLFNGQDMSGWVRENCAEGTFTARDGLIFDTGLPMGVMRSAKMYENFILEFDWQHMVSGGNSGCFAWSDGLPQVGAPFPRGIEVQVLDPGFATTHKGENEWYTCQGDLFPVHGATMTPFGRISKNGQRSFPIEDRTKPSPEWNHYHLVANAGELRLSINGKEVTVGKDCVPRRGYLSLEAEGSETHFRNLRIKELPSTNTPPEQTANAYEGFHPLFSGKDFTGWKFNDTLAPVWALKGSHFVSTAGVKGGHFDLWSEKSYRDFELIVDWRLVNPPVKIARPTFTPDGLYARDAQGQIIKAEILDAGDSGIFLRGRPDYQVNLWSQPMGSGDIQEIHKDEKIPADLRRAMLPKVHADAPFGKWNRFWITLQGDRVTVVLNGQTVIEHALLPDIPSDGPIALQYHGDAVEFANIFIHELP
jgi:hypothetical protein